MVEVDRAHALGQETTRRVGGTRRDTNHAANRLALLLDITTGLARAHDTAAAVDVICSRARSGLGASAASVHWIQPADQQLHVVGSQGDVQKLLAHFGVVPLDATVPICDAVHLRRTLMLRSRSERDRRYPAFRDLGDEFAAIAVIPLPLEDRVVGVLALGWTAERDLSNADRVLLDAVALQCAQALDRARLYDAEQEARMRAEETAGRLVILHEVAALLSGARSSAEVAELVVDRASVGAGSSCAVLFRFDADAGRLRVMAWRGIELLELPAGGDVPITAPVPGPEAMRTRQPVIWRNTAERDARFPALIGAPDAGIPARALLPLLLEDRALGVLGLGWRTERVPTPTEMAFLEAMARQCAQALDRAWLYDAEQSARRLAEGTLSRLAVLQGITARLSGARDTAEVAEVVATDVALGVGAMFAVLRRVETGKLVAVGAHNLSASDIASLSDVPIDAALPLCESVRRRRPVLLGIGHDTDTSNAPPRPESVAAPHGIGAASYACLPLLVGDRALGVLTLGWLTERMVAGDEVAFLEALVRQCAQALDRADIYDDELRARRRAESTTERLRLQQELTARLSGASDTRAVAQVIMAYAVTGLRGTGAALVRLDERRGLFHLVEATPGQANRKERFDAFSSDAPTPVGDCVRSGKPVIVRDRAERDRRYPGHADMVASADPAFVCVPLVVEERAIGALAISFAGDIAWSPADAEFLATIAHQCAQAFERARLYDQANRIATTLQDSLLPPQPPTIPGLEVAVRYRPVGRRTEVGGDFYDVFRIAPGRWGVVIGDVSGKGIAAASLTALARHTIRAAAKREPSPAEVLAFLNETVLEAQDDDRFCTVAYLEVTPGCAQVAAQCEPGGMPLPMSLSCAQVRLSIGGHPLPTLRTRGGDVRVVGAPGMAIGLLPMLDVDDHVISLATGDALVLVTDGVTEARSPAGVFAGDVVERVLRRAGSADAEELADRIERAVLDFQDGDPRDDLAVVVIRVPSAGDPAAALMRTQVYHTLECDPASAPLARRAVRAFLRDHGLAHLEYTATLLTSELVTNAVVHARTAVGLRVSAIGDRLLVEASDGSRCRPVRVQPGDEDVGGRGLMLLDRLATTWDVRRTPDGKTVWFELDLGP
jgi:GAF domain-containing protein/anti-sigma regulatory factor (Ser/Thr protein kinase)